MYDPNFNPTNGIVDTAGLAYLVARQAQLPLAMYIVNQTTGLQYTTEVVAGVMTVVQVGAGAPAIMPANPVYYVSSTGSDALSQPGTITQPLATPHEAVRRLGQTLWTGDATVHTLPGTITLPSSSEISCPSPVGNATPIRFVGELLAVLSSVPATGGTTGSTVIPVAGGTVTSAAAGAADVYKGMIMSFTAGPDIGTNYIIHSNNGAGGFTFPNPLFSAPTNADVFNVSRRVSIWAWAGVLIMSGPFILDQMEMQPGAFASFSGTNAILLDNGTRWLAAASGFSTFGYSFDWLTSPQFDIMFARPAGMIDCGIRIDGVLGEVIFYNTGTDAIFNATNSSFENVSFISIFTERIDLAFAFSSFKNCALTTGINNRLYVNVALMTAGRESFGSGAAIKLGGSAGNIIKELTVTPAAGFNSIAMDSGAISIIQHISGAPASAGKFWLTITDGARATSMSGITATGGTVGTDVQINGMSTTTARAVAFGTIEADAYPFARSVDNSATPATTANASKELGIFSLAAASGATFTWTNTLAQLGDIAIPALHTNDATAKAPITVVTDNTVTITFSGAATGSTKFSVLLIKSAL